MRQLEYLWHETFGPEKLALWLPAGIALLLAAVVLIRMLLRVPLKYNLRSLRARWVSSVMTVCGGALVVWASVLAFGLGDGLDHTLEVSGDPLDLILLRKGANAETESIVNESLARQIAAQPGVADSGDGSPLCSPELVVVINTARSGNGGKANVIIRGVTPAARLLRPHFRLVAGREPKPGLCEAMTSRSIAQRFAGAGLNDSLDVFGSPFRIVGIFEAGESASESEVWTDLKVLGLTSKRSGALSSVQLRASGSLALKALRDRMENDEQFALKAVSERQYFADQAAAGAAIKTIGVLISVFLVFGSAFAVANTMYGAVASRAREIGTLRVLGFSRTSVMASFLLESLLISVLGGVIGCLGTLPLNGLSTGTANWQTFSEITFAFRFGPKVLLQGGLLAVIMGVLGGIFPAIRAIRMPLVNALREV